jgi:hypothetical protein
MAFQIARKHMLVAKVVGHAAHVAGVGNGNGRHAAPVVAVAAGQLFGKVHGIAHGAAIAAGKDAATGGKAGNQLLGSGFDAGQRLGIGQQIVQCALRFSQAGLDMGDHQRSVCLRAKAPCHCHQ